MADKDLKSLVEKHQAAKGRLPTQEEIQDFETTTRELLRYVQMSRQRLLNQIKTSCPIEPQLVVVALLGEDLVQAARRAKYAEWDETATAVIDLARQIWPN